MSRTPFFHRKSQPNSRTTQNVYNHPPYGHSQGVPRMDLKVIMCCDKCEEKVKEEIQELHGVQHVFTDQSRSSVVVYAYADSAEVVKKAKKVHRRAELQSVTVDDRPQYYGHHGYNTPHRSFNTHGHERSGGDYYHGSSCIDNSHAGSWPHNYHQPGYTYSSTRGGSSEYQTSAYRPGQSYPSRYETDSSSDWYDTAMITNPNYVQHATRY